jgi:hypothetical protein
MNSTGGRPTYCFTGWVSEPEATAVAVPSWETVTTEWTRWCAAVYERWVAPDWSRPRSDRAELPHGTEYTAGAGLWSAAYRDHDREDAKRDELAALALVADGTELWPMSDARSLWAAAATSPERITAVLGVARDYRLLRGITHAAVFEVARRTILHGPHGTERIS